MDNMTRRQRSHHMSQIRSSGTRPERVLRQMLRMLCGVPLRCNVAGLLGKPDIVIDRLKLAVFVDGCFWHGCPEHGRMPKSRNSYWVSKIVGNMIRDEENTVALEEDGWTVWRVWEHDLNSGAVAKTRRRLRNRMKKLMAS